MRVLLAVFRLRLLRLFRLTLRLCRLRFLLAHKRDILAPSAFGEDDVMDIVQPYIALTYLRVKFRRLRHLVERQQSCQSHVVIIRKIFIHLDRIFHQLFAMLDIAAFLTTEIGVQATLRFGRRHHLEPFFLRMLTVRGQNLYLVAAFELVGQRHKRVVHFRADTMFS